MNNLTLSRDPPPESAATRYTFLLWLTGCNRGRNWQSKVHYFGFRIINLNLYFPICVKQQNTCLFFFLNHTYFVRMKPLCQLTKERFLRLFSSFPLSQKWQVFKAQIKKKKCGMVWNQWELLSIKTTCPHTEIQDNTTAGTMGALTKHQKTICSRPLKRPSMNYLEGCCL